MNQTLAVKEQSCLFEQEKFDLPKISQETDIPIWEIEHAAGEFINHCQHWTISEANKAHEMSRLYSRERFETKLRLDDLCFEAIEEYEDFYDVLSVFKFSTHESRSYRKALKKMLELADNESKLRCLIEKCPDVIDETRVEAIQKIIRLRNKDKEC